MYKFYLMLIISLLAFLPPGLFGQENGEDCMCFPQKNSSIEGMECINIDSIAVDTCGFPVLTHNCNDLIHPLRYLGFMTDNIAKFSYVKHFEIEINGNGDFSKPADLISGNITPNQISDSLPDFKNWAMNTEKKFGVLNLKLLPYFYFNTNNSQQIYQIEFLNRVNAFDFNEYFNDSLKHSDQQLQFDYILTLKDEIQCATSVDKSVSEPNVIVHSTNTSITIDDFQTDIEISKIQLYDYTMRCVNLNNLDISKSSNSVKIDAINLTNGIYLVQYKNLYFTFYKFN